MMYSIKHLLHPLMKCKSGIYIYVCVVNKMHSCLSVHVCLHYDMCIHVEILPFIINPCTALLLLLVGIINITIELLV